MAGTITAKKVPHIVLLGTVLRVNAVVLGGIERTVLPSKFAFNAFIKTVLLEMLAKDVSIVSSMNIEEEMTVKREVVLSSIASVATAPI